MTGDKRGSSGVPEGWRQSSVGEVCKSIVPGRNRPEVFDGDIPWLTTPNLTSKYVSSENAELFVSRSELVKSGGKTIPSGAVILNCVGEFGLIAIAQEELVINQQLHAFVCPASLSNEYLAYALYMQVPYMYKMATTTTIPYMNKSSCESIPVLLPPLEEQRKIAEILSTWDEAIEQQTQLLELKRERKRGLMQQLLTGRVRFKEFAGLEWDEVALEKLASFIGRGTAPTYAESETVAYAINQKCVRNGAVSTKFSRAHDDNSSIKEVSILQHHDICINSTGTGTAGRVGLWEQPKDDNYYFVDTHVTILRLQLERANPKFITDLLQTPQLQNRLEVECIFGGTNQVELSRTDLAKLSLNIPPLKEQQKIATVLSAADAEIETLTIQLSALKAQKRGMMQRLLTGKTRVQLA